MVLLVISGLIARTAGPSSAVFMVPSKQTWPGGWTQFFLNGTLDDLWPSTLTASHIGDQSCTDADIATKNPYCVAGGFQALQQWSSTLDFASGGRAKIGPLLHMNELDSLMQQTMQGYIRQPSRAARYKDTWAQATHSATAAI